MEDIIPEQVKSKLQEATENIVAPHPYELERNFKIYLRRITNPKKYTFQAMANDKELFPTPVSRANVERIFSQVKKHLKRNTPPMEDKEGVSLSSRVGGDHK